MGAVGTSQKVSGLLAKSMGNYDKRFSDDIQSAADRAHKEFPKIGEIGRIMPSNDVDGAASMDGLGILHINNNILQDYGDGMTTYHGWSAGDGTFKNSTIAHELGHNIDLKFTNMLSDYAPQGYEKPTKMPNEEWAEAYSKALGRKIKVGDTVTDIPASDISAKMFTIDGKKYSMEDVYKSSKDGMGNISDLVVPMAIRNVQSNWKALGYKSQPTTQELINGFSKYVDHYYYQGHKAFNTEVFAEAYSGHISYGKDAHPLAQEVMRLTKQAYKSATANKRNGVESFYKKLFTAQDEILKKKGGGKA